MEATIYATGWIYDHLLPHAAQVKVAHPMMLRAIAAAKKEGVGTGLMPASLLDGLRCDFLPECHMAQTRFGIDVEPYATGICWCARWCN